MYLPTQTPPFQPWAATNLLWDSTVLCLMSICIKGSYTMLSFVPGSSLNTALQVHPGHSTSHYFILFVYKRVGFHSYIPFSTDISDISTLCWVLNNSTILLFINMVISPNLYLKYLSPRRLFGGKSVTSCSIYQNTHWLWQVGKLLVYSLCDRCVKCGGDSVIIHRMDLSVMTSQWRTPIICTEDLNSNQTKFFLMSFPVRFTILRKYRWKHVFKIQN